MLFPRYNNALYSNSNSASAALSKWLKQQTKADCTMHSFRHSFRDRLRAVECSIELTDALGGWSADGIGAAYVSSLHEGCLIYYYPFLVKEER